MKCVSLDIESNGLLTDMLDFSSLPYKLKEDAKIWVISFNDIKTGECKSLVKEEITKEAIHNILKEYDFIVQHNGIKFDLIVLKLMGLIDYKIGWLEDKDILNGKEVRFIDTLILSRLISPDRYGGHSLKSWGERVGAYKDNFRQECIDSGIIDKNAPKGEEFKVFSPSMKSYCITPDMRLLDESLNWREASTYKVGESILGFDEYNQEGRFGRRYKKAEIEVITEDISEVFEVSLASGKKLKVTGEHRFLVCRNNHKNNQYDWVETKDLRSKDTNPKYTSKLPCLLPVFDKLDSFDSGWMSGMFDGEGNLTNGKGRPQYLSIAQNPTTCLDKIEKILTQESILLSKRYVKQGSNCMTVRVLGGVVETYKVLSLFRPERLLSKIDFNTWGRLELKHSSYTDEVLSVKSIGVTKILKIQTSTRTFMCEGYPMHNCEQDTKVTTEVFKVLFQEMASYAGWKQAFKMETKLADLAIRRECLGFWFDKDLAIKCVEDLTNKMEELRLKVNPFLPPKKLNKTDLGYWTPPKVQLKKDGTPSSNMLKFTEKVGGILEKFDGSYVFGYEGSVFPVPFEGALKTTTEADISNLDHVKTTLILNYGWNPTEWAERDFTKDSTKQSLTYDKRIKAFERWLKETTEEGKYQRHRLELAFENHKVKSIEELDEVIREKLHSDFPVRLATSPKVRVGVEKDLCPDLVSLGDKVDFAKDFALYLTYKHRKSSIAGGEIEDMDFDLEFPESGFLSSYREEDGRIPTPAIEIGASTNRYRHIGICNIARASSVYGKEMRSLFGCGKGAVQYGFDYASLEARIQGHYCYKYTDGEELSVTLLAEKPNDIHSVTGRKLGIPRSDAKSVNYMLMYGGSWVKAKKMLNLTDEGAKDIVNKFWDSMPALKELKSTLESQWEKNGKQFIQAIDGRKLNVRSKHSIINLLFQSGGIICAKYVSVFIMEKFEKQGLCIDPFEGNPDVCSMIEYHDEQQLYCNPKFFKFQTFDTEEEAKDFVKNWEGAQLSDISHGKKYYVVLPNIISNTIEEAIKDMEQILKLNVPLGYAYAVANNWYGCH